MTQQHPFVFLIKLDKNGHHKQKFCVYIDKLLIGLALMVVFFAGA